MISERTFINLPSSINQMCLWLSHSFFLVCIESQFVNGREPLYVWCVWCPQNTLSTTQTPRRVHNISWCVYWWSKPAPPSENPAKCNHTHGGGTLSLDPADVSSSNSSGRAVNWWTCDRVICHFYWQWLRIIWDEEWTLSLETNSLQFTQFKFNFLSRACDTVRAWMALYAWQNDELCNFSPRDFWRMVARN